MQLRYQMKHGHRDAHPRWCEVSKNPGFWLKLWPDSHQDFLPKLKLVWRFHIFWLLIKLTESLKVPLHFRTFSQREKPWLSLSTGRTGDSHGMVWRLEADCHPHHWAKTHRGLVTADRASRSFFLVSEREFDHNFLVRPCQTILNCWNILVNLYKSNPRFPC